MVVNFDYGPYRLSNVTMVPAAMELLNQGKYKDYRRRFGTHFVVGGRKQAKLISVFSITSTSSTHLQRISTMLEGQVVAPVASVSAAASLRAALEESKSTCSITWQLEAVGAKAIGETLTGRIAVGDDVTAALAAVDQKVEQLIMSMTVERAPFTEYTLQSTAAVAAQNWDDWSNEDSRDYDGLISYLEARRYAAGLRGSLAAMLAREAVDTYFSKAQWTSIQNSKASLDKYIAALDTSTLAAESDGRVLPPVPPLPIIRVPEPVVVNAHQIPYDGLVLMVGYVTDGTFRSIFITNAAGAGGGVSPLMNREDFEIYLKGTFDPNRHPELRAALLQFVPSFQAGSLFHPKSTENLQYFATAYGANQGDKSYLALKNTRHDIVKQVPVSLTGEP